MSRRFGRNQKRRMREQVEGLREANQMTARIMATIADERDELRRLVDHARYVLGDHVALPPQHKGDHPHPLGGSFDCTGGEPMSLRDFMSIGAMTSRTQRVTRMHTLLTRVRKSDRIDGQIHFLATLDSGETVYTVSDDALKNMREGVLEYILKRQIAPAMAEHLAGQFQRRQGDRHDRR